MTESEKNQYRIIKELSDHGGNKRRAALKLGCSIRSVDRHIAGYRAGGKEYFAHGNRGRAPAHALPEKTKIAIVELYNGKYYDASLKHFTELMRKHDGIEVSESAVRNILSSFGVLSPYATRKKKREHKARMARNASTQQPIKESATLAAATVTAQDSHPRRPRCAYFGEMIQTDASLHAWFGGVKSTLHLGIDDALGVIVGGWFDWQETLNGYYHMLEQTLLGYGIPYMFYSDKRTVFEYKKKGGGDANDSFTQFSYACSQLGIQIKTTSVPQAKGRIERLHSSLQKRLPVELRLEGVSTIEQANVYLAKFIADYNASFALPIDSTPSVFETRPSLVAIDRTLAVVTPRTVDNGHSVRLNNTYYRTVDKNGMPVYFYKGTKGLAIRTFSGGLYFSLDEGVFVLEEIPAHERASRNFDFKQPVQEPKKRYIPPQSHPWRLAAYAAFAKKQARAEKDVS